MEYCKKPRYRVAECIANACTKIANDCDILFCDARLFDFSGSVSTFLLLVSFLLFVSVGSWSINTNESTNEKAFIQNTGIAPTSPTIAPPSNAPQHYKHIRHNSHAAVDFRQEARGYKARYKGVKGGVVHRIQSHHKKQENKQRQHGNVQLYDQKTIECE